MSSRLKDKDSKAVAADLEQEASKSTLLAEIEELVLPPVDSRRDPILWRGASGKGLDTEELRRETSEALVKGIDVLKESFAEILESSPLASSLRESIYSLEEAKTASLEGRFASASSFTAIAVNFLEIFGQQQDYREDKTVRHLSQALSLLADFQREPTENVFPLVSAWAHIVSAEQAANEILA